MLRCRLYACGEVVGEGSYGYGGHGLRRHLERFNVQVTEILCM